ncbi:ECF sigma factor VreI [Aliidongia dinghuensis]|uniref:ECF sigma factor VreI n=1 Tax=Aliidongia dinghuensis TaxID=1867774 RepID=A0A8J2YWI4_9PROT|nr:sigma-70 family RNA polymerase sigma factor [Aliidongia dinghuensis]GGF32212.1 ECF sigma factor VreI [Aliidongia dinghuensis]
MADSREILRQRLLLDYDELKTQLARRLGSAHHAEDALQDAWLRLDGTSSIGTISRPFPYLLRIAYNLGLKRRLRDREAKTLDDARAALNLVDETPGPAEIVEARSEFAAFERALAELTPRRREILLASRADGTPLRAIADRLGISQRLVEMELKMALIHCGRRLDRKIIQRFGPRRFRGSDEQEDDVG